MPNIVLVMSDQHRADMMGCAGDAGVLTPNLDRLAGEGVRFSRVSCQGPLCMPARASFMTERYVRDHGVYTNWAEIAPDSPTYAWALREAGFHTALLGKAHLYHDEDKAAHIDDLAPRLEQLGFAEVHETGDKFVGQARRTRTLDHLRDRGLLDAYRSHIADRSYQGENEHRCEPHQARADVGRHTDAAAARRLRRRMARRASRALDRGVRPRRAVLPVRRFPGPARPVGRAARSRRPLRATSRSRCRASTKRPTIEGTGRYGALLQAFLGLVRHRHDGPTTRSAACAAPTAPTSRSSTTGSAHRRRARAPRACSTTRGSSTRATTARWAATTG